LDAVRPGPLITRQLVRDGVFPRTPGVYVVYEPAPPDERLL